MFEREMENGDISLSRQTVEQENWSGCKMQTLKKKTFMIYNPWLIIISSMFYFFFFLTPNL